MSATPEEVEAVVRITAVQAKGGQIHLSRKILEKMNVKPGDYLKLRTYKRNLSAKKVE